MLSDGRAVLKAYTRCLARHLESQDEDRIL